MKFFGSMNSKKSREMLGQRDSENGVAALFQKADGNCVPPIRQCGFGSSEDMKTSMIPLVTRKSIIGSLMSIGDHAAKQAVAYCTQETKDGTAALYNSAINAYRLAAE